MPALELVCSAPEWKHRMELLAFLAQQKRLVLLGSGNTLILLNMQLLKAMPLQTFWVVIIKVSLIVCSYTQYLTTRLHPFLNYTMTILLLQVWLKLQWNPSLFWRDVANQYLLKKCIITVTLKSLQHTLLLILIKKKKSSLINLFMLFVHAVTSSLPKHSCTHNNH